MFQGCNQLFCDLVGFDAPAEIIKTRKEKVFSDFGAHKADQIVQSLLENKEVAGVMYDCLALNNGELLWTQKRFTQLKNPDNNKIIGVLCTVFDISEQSKRTQHFNKQETNLKAQDLFYQKVKALPYGLDYLDSIIFENLDYLKRATNSSLCIWIDPKNKDSSCILYSSKEKFKTNILSSTLKKILSTFSNSGFIEPGKLEDLKQIIPETNSAYIYEISSPNLGYNNFILLTNPKPSLVENTLKNFLISRLVHCFYEYQAIKSE